MIVESVWLEEYLTIIEHCTAVSSLASTEHI